MQTIRGTEFRFTRPVLSVRGFYSRLDSYVNEEIVALNKLLSGKYLKTDSEETCKETFWIETKAGDKIYLEDLLKMDIGVCDKKSIDSDQSIDWPDGLITVLGNAQYPSDGFSFLDLIDLRGDTGLFDDVGQKINDIKLSYNASKLLSEKPILAYLFCRALYYLRKRSDSAIFNYISKETEEGGIKLFYNYLVIKVAFAIRDDTKLETNGDAKFLKKVYDKLINTNIDLSAETFTPSVTGIIKGLYDNEDQHKIIKKWKEKLSIEEEDVPALISYIKQSEINGIKIHDENAGYYLPIALNEIKNSGITYSSALTPNIVDSDFSVKFYEDEKASLEILRENIACAAQMYYVMTLGDELEIFNVINRIITYYLPSGQVDISSKDILKDLQLYVFKDSFTDSNKVEYKRTHPEERMMFYKQLFNVGGGEILDGMAVNKDFNILWGRLLSETARYIEKIATSQNPTLYVSNQNICQALEDLQYNLSTHCSGMTKVASPIINKELDFVIEKFLKNEELIKQLALNNGRSFWKVIERVLIELRNEVPNVSALRSKGVLGYKIISTIANYNQGDFDDDKKLFDFISAVEAYIIANDELENGRDELESRLNNGTSGIENGYRGDKTPEGEIEQKDDWNF